MSFVFTSCFTEIAGIALIQLSTADQARLRYAYTILCEMYALQAPQCRPAPPDPDFS